MPHNVKTVHRNAATASAYVPNWRKEHERWRAYASKDGKGYEEARRHRRALISAIRKHVRDPAQCQKLLAAVSAGGARSLAYMNPFARLLWASAVMSAFRKNGPKGTIFATTIVSNLFSFNTKQAADSAVNSLKVVLEATFRHCGANVFGNVEFAVFPKNKIGDGYRVSAHFQGLVWGVCKHALKTLLRRLFLPLADGTPGSWVEEVRRSAWFVISYNLKAPAYGYQSWPRADGQSTHLSMSIPRRGHWQLLQQFSGLRWPDLTIAVGAGEKILSRAIRKVGDVPRSPLADFSIAAANSASASASAIFTLNSGINAAVAFTPSNKPLEQCTNETTATFQNYLQQQKATKGKLYSFLQHVYGLAFEFAGREEELQALVQRKGLTFNRASDLIALSLKCAIPRENYNKKRASDWAQALRYLYMNSCRPDEVSERLAEFGISKCSRAVMHYEQARDDSGELTEEPWEVVDKYGKSFEVATNQLDMPFAKGILFAEQNDDKNRLVVRHGIDSDHPVARSILKKLAQHLQKTHSWEKFK